MKFNKTNPCAVISLFKKWLIILIINQLRLVSFNQDPMAAWISSNHLFKTLRNVPPLSEKPQLFGPVSRDI